MEDFECDSFYNMDLDLEWDNEDILSSAIQECGLEGFDEEIDLSCIQNESDEVENTNVHHEITNIHKNLSGIFLQNAEADNEDYLMSTLVDPTTNMPNLEPWTPEDPITYKISVKQEENNPKLKTEEIEENRISSVVDNNNYVIDSNNYDSSSDSGIDNAESEIITAQPGRNYSSTIIVLPIEMIKKKTPCSEQKKTSSSRTFHLEKENFKNGENQKLSEDKKQYFQSRDNKVLKKSNATRKEEQTQKLMRRKIRNREAAQKSRIQKKLYVRVA